MGNYYLHDLRTGNYYVHGKLLFTRQPVDGFLLILAQLIAWEIIIYMGNYYLHRRCGAKLP